MKKECADCGDLTDEEDLIECEVCEEPFCPVCFTGIICNDCSMEKCAGCGDLTDLDQLTICEVCEDLFCPACIAIGYTTICDECQKKCV